MTSGMMAGRGFFPPGKGGRRGFPMIGDEFGYFPHDKPFHDFGYGPQNFGPPPGEGFFPGPPLGFMGGHPGGPPPNMEPGSMHGGPMGGPMGGPPQGPPLPPHPGNGESPFPPGSMLGGDSGDSRDFSMGDGMTQPPRPSPSEFQNSQGEPDYFFYPLLNGVDTGWGIHQIPFYHKANHHLQMIITNLRNLIISDWFYPCYAIVLSDPLATRGSSAKLLSFPFISIKNFLLLPAIMSIVDIQFIRGLRLYLYQKKLGWGTVRMNFCLTDVEQINVKLVERKCH